MSFRFGICGGDDDDSGGGDAVVVVAGRFQREMKRQQGEHRQMKGQKEQKWEEEEEEEEKGDDGDGGGCNRGQKREAAGRALWDTSQRSSGDVQKKVAWLGSGQKGNEEDGRGRGHVHSFRAFFSVTFFQRSELFVCLSVFCGEEEEASASVEEGEERKSVRRARKKGDGERRRKKRTFSRRVLLEEPSSGGGSEEGKGEAERRSFWKVEFGDNEEKSCEGW